MLRAVGIGADKSAGDGFAAAAGVMGLGVTDTGSGRLGYFIGGKSLPMSSWASFTGPLAVPFLVILDHRRGCLERREGHSATGSRWLRLG